MSIHKNYLKLTPDEKKLVDRLINHCMVQARKKNMHLAGDDRCEVAVEALATWVIESR